MKFLSTFIKVFGLVSLIAFILCFAIALLVFVARINAMLGIILIILYVAIMITVAVEDL